MVKEAASNVMDWIKGPHLVIAFLTLAITLGYNLSRVQALDEAQAKTQEMIIDVRTDIATIKANTSAISDRMDRIGDAVKGMRDDLIHNQAQRNDQQDRNNKQQDRNDTQQDRR